MTPPWSGGHRLHRRIRSSPGGHRLRVVFTAEPRSRWAAAWRRRGRALGAPAVERQGARNERPERRQSERPTETGAGGDPLAPIEMGGSVAPPRSSVGRAPAAERRERGTSDRSEAVGATDGDRTGGDPLAPIEKGGSVAPPRSSVGRAPAAERRERGTSDRSEAVGATDGDRGRRRHARPDRKG